MQTTSIKTYVRIATPVQRHSANSAAARRRSLAQFLAVLLKSLSAWCM
jgi:hypothetical protein